MLFAMRSVARESRGSYALGGIPPENSLSLYRLSGKLAGASMRSKDLAKAAGLAVAFDHTAPPLLSGEPFYGLQGGASALLVSSKVTKLFIINALR